MDEFNENDPLWKTLGQTKSVSASPYFVRKVLREVRTERQSPSRFTLILRWLMPLGAATALAIVAGVWQFQRTDDTEFNAYFDSAADLQSLVAFEDTSLWVEGN